MSRLSLIFHGGVSEIGGNKIILKDGDTTILLDFGVSFTLRGQYYSVPFLSPRDERGLLEFGILPDLKGIYRFDPQQPEIDAVFLSHSHMDHAAYISLLKREIPIYCGDTTATILDALSEIRLSNFEFSLEGVSLRTFRTGDKIKINSLEIEPIHVDHSVPGSYGFLVYTSSGVLAYTGDFRRHGSKPNLTEDFLSKCTREKPDIVISENTNVVGVEVSSEEEVAGKITSIVEHAPGLVLANFACADVDRLRSLHTVATKNCRQLVVNLRQAYLLHRLRQDPRLDVPKLDDDHISIFQKAKKRYFKWEQETMKLGRTVDAQEINREQQNTILATSFCDLAELVEIDPSPGSCYVLSASEPFNEEMEIDFNRLTKWLEHYGLPQYHVHVSGHITPFDLRNALTSMHPRKIFPIHGNHPVLFAKFLKDSQSEIVVPEKSKPYELS